ncbi:cytochrome C biogenesis protein [Hyphomicrobium nitrativorans NL23]|uniref:Cytochrome C biogenesis protein n=1 Tax=Hyphomicrobium nitrativorans NL23 TaxID=1029756 RepID=V5SGE9_9HYPH|nr:c-type cytochrome biogenesis protein CcmI [Hyphomicrobium nitrativorans]AHB49029.1 cytochrome C biogenesis protein [Hyphomicrobium nitrativorans NL23]
MLLWVSFAILTAAVVAYLLRPLRQAQGPAAIASEAADVAVYRDQLKELDAERERGLIPANEHASARAEIARRLIKRAGKAESVAAEAERAGENSKFARRIYASMAALVPLLGIVLYLGMGSPHLPAQPFAARDTGPGSEIAIAGLIQRVEERLREHPEDGQGWDVIAPIYLRIGRYPEAAHAYAEANRLQGESDRRLLGFAEATLLAESGVVTEPVRTAALRLLQLDATHVQPRVWLALAREQDGDLAGAVADYRTLLSGAPDDAPWRDAVAERLLLVEARLRGEKVEAQPAPGTADGPQSAAPNEGEVSVNPADVSSMSREEQDAFVGDMVARLAARLEETPQDIEGWLRLARAYKVLGRDDDARLAIVKARGAFAGDQEALGRIAGAETALGLGAKEDRTTP